MLKHINRAVFFGLCVIAGQACSTTTNTNDFQRLLPDTCVPLVASKLKLDLGAEWLPYQSSTRVCPLVKLRGAKADVVLITISVENYYRDKPVGAKWENFPKPILFNEKGARVGELAELFPGDDVVEMVLTYGHWQGNIPSEIRMHIIDPTVTGDYDLPSLLWSNERQRYLVKDKPARKEVVK